MNPPRGLNTLNQIMVPINPPPLPPNLPCGHLIEGSREDYIKICVPLFEASIKGDWRAAKSILEKKPELVRFAITKNFDTPLHIAASAKRTKYVENLLEMMKSSDLELQNKSYNTGLSLAATAGDVQIAKIILGKNKAMLDIPDSQGMMPLYMAVFFARNEMVRYLYGISNKMSGDLWTNENRDLVLQKCVEADIFDVAVKIVNECPQLTSNKRLLRDLLLVLARKTEAFTYNRETEDITLKSTVKSRYRARRETDALRLLKIIWNKISIMPDNEIDQILQGPPLEIKEEQHKRITYPSRVLFLAAEMGNVKFIVELLRSYPDLIWTVDDEGLSIFHIAAKHRQEDVYNMLYEIGSMKDLITIIEDKNGNNMLHIVAKSSNPKRYHNRSEDALQMQQELIWFQEVRFMVPPTYRDKKNRDGETPHEVFTKNHAILLAKSEKWIKEMAPQCLVGATIIATMAFTAAFTAPGGYDQNTGIPILLHKPAFLAFLIAIAFSLIYSSTSILILLSMFTSSYDEHAFLVTLPKKMMISVLALYFSIMSMMVAFCASFLILYDNTDLKWISFVVTGMANNVVLLFISIQYPFIKEMMRSTYKSESPFNRKKPMLY